MDHWTFKEIGEAVFYVANASQAMSLNYADAEGLVLDVVVGEDFEVVLDGTIESLKRDFKRVEIELEEADFCD